MDRRPPLALSPRRLRPRRRATPPPVASSVQTTPGSIKKAKTSVRSSICALPPSRPEPSPPTKLDLTAAMARKTKEELDGIAETGLNTAAAMNWSAPSSPLFERGRFYDLYSARRNERLKRKQAVLAEEAEAMAGDPCVAVELSKRRGCKKATESVRKSMPVEFSASRATSLRSSLRSSKEMKKASAATPFAAARSTAVKERRSSARLSSRRI